MATVVLPFCFRSIGVAFFVSVAVALEHHEDMSYYHSANKEGYGEARRNCSACECQDKEWQQTERHHPDHRVIAGFIVIVHCGKR
jgi:hypothetical protein